MHRVLIAQEYVPFYRVAFFEHLARSLACAGVTLQVAYGEPHGGDVLRRYSVDLHPSIGLRVRNRWLMGGRLLVQPLMKEVFRSDLVVVEQANKNLANLMVLPLSRLHLTRVAFWGHGYNRSGRTRSLGEAWKVLTLRSVDWWFAYTTGTARYLESRGFPKDRVTVVQNSNDTVAFRRDVSAVTPAELRLARNALGATDRTTVGLYCGSLYREKRVEFLLEAARGLRTALPDFHLVVLGGGAEEELVRRAARGAEWIHYMGSITGHAKSIYFRLAHVALHPGAVGLGVLDAFAAGLPLVTTAHSCHGPEIEYIESGLNGLVTANSLDAYVGGVVSILCDTAFHDHLSRGALDSSRRYTIDAMVRRFADGILSCLGVDSPGPMCGGPRLE